jgi:hypothetical protein
MTCKPRQRRRAIVTVTGAGHLLPIEAPAAIADAYSGRSIQST